MLLHADLIFVFRQQFLSTDKKQLITSVHESITIYPLMISKPIAKIAIKIKCTSICLGLFCAIIGVLWHLIRYDMSGKMTRVVHRKISSNMFLCLDLRQ